MERQDQRAPPSPGSGAPEPPRPWRPPGEQEQGEEAATAGAPGPRTECPLCVQTQPASAFPRPPPPCAHRSCLPCLQRYVRLEVRESRVPVACPHCPAPLPPELLSRLLAAEPDLRAQHDEFLLRRLLLAEPGARWCPAPNCSYAVIASGCGEDGPRLVCGRPECRTEFCYDCRQRWHPGAPCERSWRRCDRLRRQKAAAPPAKRQRNAAAAAQGEPEAVKLCPRCGALVTKAEDGGCNRMSCPLCGCLFCWLCLREISDVHFLSPSGCTFWGKKPWSRRRKVLWQLAMVLGAPMAIALAAGVAVPVITLGIPIYTGKKVLSHGRKRRRSACQQCLSLAGSCLLSLLVSPVITAVTVGLGVPLGLAYAYGAVLLSMCRNRGGCGGGSGELRKPGELGATELEIPGKLNDLLAVLPTSPLAAEGDRVATASLPSRRQGQQKEPCQGQQDSRSTGAVARAGSASGKAREAADRQEPNAVEVEVEAEAAQEQSLCHASPGPGISAASLTGTSAAACSLAGVTAE